jgi:hypothetical protein
MVGCIKEYDSTGRNIGDENRSVRRRMGFAMALTSTTRDTVTGGVFCLPRFIVAKYDFVNARFIVAKCIDSRADFARAKCVHGYAHLFRTKLDPDAYCASTRRVFGVGGRYRLHLDEWQRLLYGRHGVYQIVCG